MCAFLDGNVALEYFGTSSIWTGYDFFYRLVPAMSTCTQLQRLHVQLQSLLLSQPSCIQALTRWLFQPACPLTKLHLPSWSLNDEQLAILFAALPHNQSLRSFSSATSLSPESTASLIRLLADQRVPHLCNYQPLTDTDPLLLRYLQRNSVFLILSFFLSFSSCIYFQDRLFRSEQRWKSIWLVVAFLRANRHHAYKWSAFSMVDDVLACAWEPPYQAAEPNDAPYGTCICCDKFVAMPYSFSHVSDTNNNSNTLGYERLTAFSYTAFFDRVINEV